MNLLVINFYTMLGNAKLAWNTLEVAAILQYFVLFQ